MERFPSRSVLDDSQGNSSANPFPNITVSLIMAFVCLYNCSGIAYTIGLTLSSVGRAFLFLSGSGISANSLFGNLQVVAANQISLSDILMTVTNSSGAITSKIIPS
ncbi:unnamed protein product [Rhizopus stolonifer]